MILKATIKTGISAYSELIRVTGLQLTDFVIN